MKSSNKAASKNLTTSIMVRLLEIKENGDVVLKKEKFDHLQLPHDGYYEFLLKEDNLKEVMDNANPKRAMFEYLAIEYNRSFMEFLMLEINIDQAYLASVHVLDYEEEFSYLESEFMDGDSYMESSVHQIYEEEIGMLSDFDYYPRGL